MKLIYSLLRTFRGTIILAALVGFISGVSGAALIALINAQLTAGLFNGKALVRDYVALAALALASNVISQLLLTRLTQDTSFDLRVRLSEEILSAPLPKLEELGSPRLLAILTEDISAVIAAFLGLPALCVNLATLLACLAYLGRLSSNMLAGVSIFLLAGAVVRHLLAVRGLRSLKLAREEANHLLKHYRAMTEGSKELKLHNKRRAAFLDEEVRATARTMRDHNLTGLTFYSLAEGWSKLLFYIFFGVILFVLPSAQAIDTKTLTGYTLIVLYIMGPLGALLNFLPTMSRARIAIRHVEGLSQSLTVEGGQAGLEHAPATDTGWKRLQMIGVTHSYRQEGKESNFILGPIDLQFQPGEVVYLVGGNGSGKTTLAKLLTGLYAPESGEIRLNGRRVTDEGKESYRQLFSVIFADFYLFDRLLGIDGADLDQRAARLLKKVRLDQQVTVDNGAFSRVNLSIGQRKRLALLATYLEDRPFYVFDEWAAGQDPEFRDLFYLQFLPELKRRGKAILVITHDEKYFHLADRLIKLDCGRITELAELSFNGETPFRPPPLAEGWFGEPPGKETTYEQQLVTYSSRR
jgi:putative pyoverdin transport system ATP-binding/permease protein